MPRVVNNSATAVQAAFRYVRIAAALFFFWGGYMSLAGNHSADSRAVEIMTGAGAVVAGVFLLVWNTCRVWLAYVSLGAMIALLLGMEAYEIAIGEKQWRELWMTVAFLSMLLFGGPLWRRLTGGYALPPPTKE